ncbi:MAG: T9SS type A sorting domain-containing protein, partial [Ignavibacteriales bacterium]|nr:T9SS type A sorting domain-containing protein [Ignavibacteriales bacterium]
SAFGPGFGAYTLIDTIMTGMVVESIDWQPRKNKAPLLWASSGNRNDPPIDSLARLKYGRIFAKNAWYGYDVDTKQFVDSIKWGATFPANPTYDDTISIGNGDPRNRGIAFTQSGDTAYVAMYMLDSNSVKMFTKPSTGVAKDEGVVARQFELHQNYPNPFNPTTQIKFSLDVRSTISLKVYDVLGKEVEEIASGEYEAGAYTASFNAQSLSAGIYFYSLKTSEGFVQTKKMLFLK